jgi:ABC-2 type transport system ATP-binding protein
MSQAIVAHDLTVRKGKKIILDKLTFAARKGSLTGLIGPSGSGKTTLMRSIVGVQAYDGKLDVLGKSAGDKSLRPQVGYVTQSPAVYGDLTVKQNIGYFAAIAGANADQVAAVIETVRLSSQTNQLVDSLSGGQRARVSLAVALLGNPDVLVLDEPTVGLDPILRNELWEVFASLARQGKTLLISSHVMDEAERCGDLLLIRDGKLIWNDSKSELLKKTKTRDVGSAFIAIIGGAK